jgi:signal transduction histidine kinase
MAVLGTRARNRPRMLVVAGFGVLVLAAFAARADAQAVGSRSALTTLDLAVGFAFVLAPALALGSPGERLLIGAVGPAWLAGSVFASARSLHQGVLAVALLAFPTGRLAGLPRQILAFGAILVACEMAPQLGVAALFAAIAVAALATIADARGGSAYPAAASISVTAGLVFSWWALRRSAVASPVVVYEIILIAVALAFPVATRMAARSRAALADRLLGDPRFAGLPGLRQVLSGVLADPDLKIDPWDAQAHAYVDSGNDEWTGSPSTGFTVFDGDQLLARVVTTSPALVDRPTATAVGSAVRLVVINQRLREQQARRIADLEVSRARLLAAADRERERMAERLRTGPGAALHEARNKLSTVGDDDNPELCALVEIAAEEVAAAAKEVQRIVDGAPPTALGAGELRRAIEGLAAGSPVEVRLALAADTAADATIETVLFYVCSEALANATKHSAAKHVVIDLQHAHAQLVLLVHDDGRGGADASGSGLQGLADRVAAAGGTLEIRSPTGGGTTVTAVLPHHRG